MVAIFAESLTLGDFLMYSGLNLNQRHGGRSLMLTGFSVIFVRARNGEFKAGFVSRLNESIANFYRLQRIKTCDSVGLKAWSITENRPRDFGRSPSNWQPSLQKRRGSNIATRAPGRAQIA